MKKQRNLYLTMVFLMIVNLTACGSNSVSPEYNNGTQQAEIKRQPEVQPQYTLKFGCSASAESTGGTIGNICKQFIEKNSNGRIKVDFFPNAQLGTDNDLIRGCMAGNIQMATMASAPAVNYIPQLGVLDLPGAYTDITSTYEALSGPVRDKISGYYAKAGLKLILLTPIGFRVMSSNTPIRKLEDFKGIKIRTMDNPYHQAFWKVLGANPVSLSFAELFVALQRGVVDAQENPIDGIVQSKLYENQKYIINTNHIMFISTLFMNKELYDSMPSDLQKVVDDLPTLVEKYYMQITIDADRQAYKLLEDKGLKVIDLPKEEMKRIQRAAKPVYDMIRQKVGDDLVNTFLERLEEERNKKPD